MPTDSAGPGPVARKRLPRVRLQYVSVGTDGALRNVELPFVVGVMAGLSGTPAEPLPPLAERTFTAVDVGSFDAFLRAQRPRLAFEVPNRLTGQGNLKVDITFECMDDFSPAAVARQLPALDACLAARALDQRFAAQLSVILHHEAFSALEGSWRGLQRLVSSTATGEDLRIRVLNLSKRELAASLKEFGDESWGQGPLFRELYEKQYGRLGGEPYGCLVGDYYFDHSPEDVAALAGMARIAAACHAPFISGAAPSLVQIGSWQELSQPRDLSRALPMTDCAQWHALRRSDDSRFIGLTMPRILARLPYGDGMEPVAEFPFGEDVNGDGVTQLVWHNAAYAMAQNIARAFHLYGWCACIHGAESGGMVAGLPCHTTQTADGGMALRGPTETAITERRGAELEWIGLIPLSHCKNTDFAVFFSARSLHEPAASDAPDTAATARLHARLPYVFAASRIVHYLKCMVRDKDGVSWQAEEAQQWLNGWVSQYVTCDPLASEETKARYPLASAEVRVEVPEGTAGDYWLCTLRVSPHYQLGSCQGAPLPPVCTTFRLPVPR